MILLFQNNIKTDLIDTELCASYTVPSTACEYLWYCYTTSTSKYALILPHCNIALLALCSITPLQNMWIFYRSNLQNCRYEHLCPFFVNKVTTCPHIPHVISSLSLQSLFGCSQRSEFSQVHSTNKASELHVRILKGSLNSYVSCCQIKS